MRQDDAIYVTHDRSEAMTLGGRIAIMQRGATVKIGVRAEDVVVSGAHAARFEPAPSP